MKLLKFTAAQIKDLQKQFPLGADIDKQKVIVKVFDPCGSWTWYIMNQDPNDPNYLWGIVKGFEIEQGSISLSELQATRRPVKLGGMTIGKIPLERDLHFHPMNAKELWEKLQRGEHV
jgi:hypothetical protein